MRGDLDIITRAEAGGAGDDMLVGGAAAELLLGGGGDDTLDGACGDDVLAGGTGSDTFIFADGGGHDMIADFDAIDPSEQIDLSGVTDITDAADLFANHLSVVDGVVTIQYGDNAIALTGVALGDLDAADFIF